MLATPSFFGPERRHREPRGARAKMMDISIPGVWVSISTAPSTLVARKKHLWEASATSFRIMGDLSRYFAMLGS